jgi:hypothetical protein
MHDLAVPHDLQQAYLDLARDLEAVFGPRLTAVVAFGPRIRTAMPARGRRSPVPGDALALVDRVTFDDLLACSGHSAQWHRGGLHMPLLLGREEFQRSFDAFALEYDDIVAHHVVVAGANPFAGMTVSAEDLRRGCEARAKGHLFHLREGYLEARGRPGDLADLITASSAPFSALLGNLARLSGAPPKSARDRAQAIAAAAGIAADVVLQVLSFESDPWLDGEEATRLYPAYLAAVERLVAWVDEWPKR